MEADKKKTFKIPVSNGILEHGERIGDAIWLFLWCIDKTTQEWTAPDGSRIGRVCGTCPLRDGDIAKSLPGFSARVIRKFRTRLVREGYLRQRRTPYGHVLEVFKSKKWRDPSAETELPKRVIHPSERIAQTGTENYPNGSRELPKSVNTKKTLQDSTRQSSSRRIAQTGNSDGEPMYDPDDKPLALAGRVWQKLGISRLSSTFQPFIDLVNRTKPGTEETVATWCSKILDGCEAEHVTYPRVFLRMTQEFREKQPQVNFYSMQERIEESRRRRGLT